MEINVLVICVTVIFFVLFCYACHRLGKTVADDAFKQGYKKGIELGMNIRERLDRESAIRGRHNQEQIINTVAQMGMEDEHD